MFMSGLRGHLPRAPGAVQCRVMRRTWAVCSRREGLQESPWPAHSPHHPGPTPSFCAGQRPWPRAAAPQSEGLLTAYCPSFVLFEIWGPGDASEGGQKRGSSFGEEAPPQTSAPCQGTSLLSTLKLLPPATPDAALAEAPGHPQQPRFLLPLHPSCPLLQNELSPAISFPLSQNKVWVVGAPSPVLLARVLLC